MSSSDNAGSFLTLVHILKQILVCLYGTSGSIWNKYSNVRVFEEINKHARQILLKTKDIVQRAGFDLIYADTDAVVLKRTNATRQDFVEIMYIVRIDGIRYSGSLNPID